MSGMDKIELLKIAAQAMANASTSGTQQVPAEQVPVVTPVPSMIQPTTWLGLGTALGAVSQLVVSQGTDPMAWGTLVTGLAGVFLNERSKFKR